jgi:hypothetical protein
MTNENAKFVDIATITTGITAPMWVDALEHWLSLIAAFLAVVLLIMRIYRMGKSQVDKDF